MVVGAKFISSMNFANVLILVTLAPVKSLPGVVSLTVRSKADILGADDKFDIVNVGLGS